MQMCRFDLQTSELANAYQSAPGIKLHLQYILLVDTIRPMLKQVEFRKWTGWKQYLYLRSCINDKPIQQYSDGKINKV